MAILSRALALSVLCTALSGCLTSKEETATTRSPATIGVGGPVLVSWAANRETEVGLAGGGYRVYYSQTSNSAIGSTSFVDVPHNGTATPTSVTIPFLPPGANYIRVVAYTSTKPAGSSPSAQFTVNVP